jgi:hypothetical protein
MEDDGLPLITVQQLTGNMPPVLTVIRNETVFYVSSPVIHAAIVNGTVIPEYDGNVCPCPAY